jgi:hypothetical protein
MTKRFGCNKRWCWILRLGLFARFSRLSHGVVVVVVVVVVIVVIVVLYIDTIKSVSVCKAWTGRNHAHDSSTGQRLGLGDGAGTFMNEQPTVNNNRNSINKVVKIK